SGAPSPSAAGGPGLRAAAAPAGVYVTARPLDVLLVDDDPGITRAIRRLLSVDGHRVQVATSLASAEDAASQSQFDLLICDLQLTDGSGLELLPRLQSRGGKKPDGTMPAIVLSGSGRADDIERTRAAGFAAPLLKPVDE